MRTKMNKNPLNIDAYCDSIQMKKQVDPRLLLLDKERLNKTSARYKDSLKNYTMYNVRQIIEDYILNGIDGYLTNDNINLKVVSPLIHVLSSYYPLKELCKLNMPKG
jgi:predicted DNA-binding protein